MELNKPPKVVNIFVFQDHFTKHVIANVTHKQAIKTVINFLDQRCIPIIGVLAKLFNGLRVTSRDTVLQELSELLRSKRIKTSPYHALGDEQLRHTHYAVTQMTGKL